MVGMGNTPQQKPYHTLGRHLRYLREQHSESLAEVSGAVEIDEKLLERIEAGQERPAEDILLLLISHFDMQDQEAVQLWELAGYDGRNPSQTEEVLHNIVSGQKPVVVVVGADSRTMYTDSIDIHTSKAGVVMNFGQLNHKKQQQAVATLGMSYEQAQEVLKQLQYALLRGKFEHDPKALPPPTDELA